MARLTRMLHEGGVFPPARSAPMPQPPAGSSAPVPSAAAALVRDSLAPNTRRAYLGALARLDVWLDTRAFGDHTLAVYLGHLDVAGRAPASASKEGLI